MKSLHLVFALALVVACSSAPAPTRCTPGASVACVCPGVGTGAQVCAADGASYGACACGVDAGGDTSVTPGADATSGADVAVAVADVPALDAVTAEDRPAAVDAVAVADAPQGAADAGTISDVVADAVCDAALAADPANCGTCGVVCPIRQGSFPSCVSGTCVSTCMPGMLDCDRMSQNGCEVSGLSDPANCGACRRACEAGQECVRSQCLTACATGRTRCSTTGGCFDLMNDAMNCGACGVSCGGAAPCRNGACDCGPGQSICRTGDSISCFNLRNSDFHCGACGNRCPADLPTCRDGTCSR